MDKITLIFKDKSILPSGIEVFDVNTDMKKRDGMVKIKASDKKMWLFNAEDIENIHYQYDSDFNDDDNYDEWDLY